MRFGILGPVQIRIGAREISLARRERILLAMLLLSANRTVSQQRLTDAIWEDRPPADATGQVHACVYRIRRQLAAAGAPRELVATDAAGYQVRVDPPILDLTEFRALRDRARAVATNGDLTEAVDHYRAALGLWRGPALGGIDSAIVRHAAASLEEERLQATEECIETELSLDRGGKVIPELTELVGQHPHREGFHRALMLALYRSGRPADALAAFRHARQLLHEELGIEPGAELQRVHQAILNRDPALDLPAASERSQTAEARRPPAPRELPADVAGFIGRDLAIETLDALLTDAADRPQMPMAITLIAGTAGVGKTALAVRWAHLRADRFPDGQLFVNLRGYATDRPVSPADALAGFLTSLGLPGQEIPVDLPDRIARYRTEVAGRRMLIVLDNAVGVEQIRPLLPGSNTCTVVVTSRDRMAGLVAVDGAHRTDLDLLPLLDAITLLRRLIGSRIDTELDAAAKLANQCARLPLALRIAAELAASRPTVRLADLVTEMDDQHRRLELLDVDDDPHAAVTNVFSWSIQHLPPEVARTFRLLGLHHGPDLDPYATAALTGTSLAQSQHALDLLVRAHLVHPTSSGRYGLHDLLRAYASQLTATQDEPEQRQAALNRLFDYYVATAAAAMDGWHPAEAGRRPRIPALTTPQPDLTHPDTSLKWLDTERPCLCAVAAQAATHGSPVHTIKLSNTLQRYLQSGGHYVDALSLHGYAHRAAEQVGDIAEQAHALRCLGGAHLQMGRPGPAADLFRRVLDIFQSVDDTAGMATALNNLGVAEERLGNYAPGTDHYRQALILFRQLGERSGEANTLTGLGVIEERQGHYGSAADYYRQALALFAQLGNQAGEAIALTNLGNVAEQQGDYERAADHHRRALVTFRAQGNRQGTAHALSNLGKLQLRLRGPHGAVEHFEQALTLFREIGDLDGEAQNLNKLGDTALVTGNPTAALTHHTAALSIAVASDPGIRDQQAHAHTGLGHAHRDLGDLARAQTHYDQALALYADLGMPDVEVVRDHLAAIRSPTMSSPVDPADSAD